MAYSSQLSIRGWVLAISLAGSLTGVFWFMHGYTLISGPEFYHARRTPNVAALTTKASVNIATETMPSEPIEPSFPNEASDWYDYRSRPATSAFAIVEPTAGVRLLAPSVGSIDLELLASQAVNRQLVQERKLASSMLSVSRVKTTNSIPNEQPPVSRSKESTSHNSNGGVWPYPPHLMEQLTNLKDLAEDSGNDASLRWIYDVESTIEPLMKLSGNDPAAAQIMDSLQRLAIEALEVPVTDFQLDYVSQVQTRIAHSIIRRLAIWKAVWSCVSEPSPAIDSQPRASFDMEYFRQCVEEVTLATQATGDVPGWEEYLLIDELRGLSAGSELDVQIATHTAQVVLARITSINTNAVQRLFLDSASVRKLAESIQPLAVAPVDYCSLLADIERIEENAEHRSRLTLITAMQSLRFADNPKQVAVSKAIDAYYRNANVRIAVSGAFVNRLLPTNKTLQRPVRQTILGAETSGNSDVNTSLSVRLNPDPSAWNINLDLNGKIQSQTRSSRGPATFFNSSMADVATSRAIRITAQGVQVQGNQADVTSQDSLRGLETNYDDLPFVGDMVRYFAQKEFREKRGPARRILQRTIATQTDAEFDKQLDSQLQKAELSIEQKLIGPLRNLDLNPMVTDLQTTTNRLIARYRLASDNSLAANTPRPQAPSDSLISIQMHQSAMNNGFSQLGLSHRDWTLLELTQNLAKQFGQEPVTSLSDEIPADVLIRFDGERPILVEFLDGRLWLTLRIAVLTQPGRIELTDFVIRTSYVPAATGLEAELVREGPISVDGDRISARERIPLRIIFAKVFEARSKIPMVSPELLKDPRTAGLAISQLVLEENWLAIAVSEMNSPHVAILRDLQLQR